MSIPNNEYFVQETHGTALLRIVIVKSIAINRDNYDVQIEFQGNTVKIKLAAVEYPTSRFDSVPREATEIMRSVADEREYKLQRGRERAYLSMTRKMGKELWNLNVDEIVDKYNEEYKVARDIAREIEQRLRGEQRAG